VDEIASIRNELAEAKRDLRRLRGALDGIIEIERVAAEQSLSIIGELCAQRRDLEDLRKAGVSLVASIRGITRVLTALIKPSGRKPPPPKAQA